MSFISKKILESSLHSNQVTSEFLVVQYRAASNIFFSSSYNLWQKKSYACSSNRKSYHLLAFSLMPEKKNTLVLLNSFLITMHLKIDWNSNIISYNGLNPPHNLLPTLHYDWPMPYIPKEVKGYAVMTFGMTKGYLDDLISRNALGWVLKKSCWQSI